MLDLSPGEAARQTGQPIHEIEDLLRPPPEEWLRDQERRLSASGARLVVLGDPEYPARLAEIPDAPLALFARGLPLGEAPHVAIVGSRQATRTGLEVARGIATGLARAGATVVSGFARGIDGAAHRGALDGGGPTVGVLGCGADVLYPAEHRKLHAELLAKGTLLSELPLGTPPAPFQFPVRNRIIAGLSRLVVVVEAVERSGSLITARLANEYGRDVGAVPGSVVSPQAAGTNALLKDGAILIRSADDVLAELPELAGRIPSRAARAEQMALVSPDASLVLSALRPFEPRDADALADATSLPADRLAVALVELELAGRVEALPGALFTLRG